MSKVKSWKVEWYAPNTSHTRIINARSKFAAKKDARRIFHIPLNCPIYVTKPTEQEIKSYAKT